MKHTLLLSTPEVDILRGGCFPLTAAFLEHNLCAKHRTALFHPVPILAPPETPLPGASPPKVHAFRGPFALNLAPSLALDQENAPEVTV